MVCLDTTILADLIRKQPEANKKLKMLSETSKGFSTTIVNIAELFYGAYKSNNVKQGKEDVNLILSRFVVFEMDETCAERYGQIRSNLWKIGQIIPDRDMMIAAIALSNGENIVVTRNRKDFERIPGLTVETY
jgi:predicted nucleic acid-binding protein